MIAPATGERLAEIAAATPADVDAAVQAARAQFDGGEWSRVDTRGELDVIVASGVTISRSENGKFVEDRATWNEVSVLHTLAILPIDR